jgi:acetyltransferase-like isoleucine patch superfamily enzyme
MSGSANRVGLRDVLRWDTVVHLAKVVRFHVYDHAIPRRDVVAGPGLRMSPTASLRNGARIRLGSGVHVGEHCYLWAGNSTGTITLGDNALLAPEVFITASNYRTVAGIPVKDQEKDERDVVVGADVWLGTRVVVLPGVTIGDGAIVGAGAVVAHDLPAGCIAVGVPARVVSWRAGAGPDDKPAAAGPGPDVGRVHE